MKFHKVLAIGAVLGTLAIATPAQATVLDHEPVVKRPFTSYLPLPPHQVFPTRTLLR